MYDARLHERLMAGAALMESGPQQLTPDFWDGQCLRRQQSPLRTPLSRMMQTESGLFWRTERRTVYLPE